MSRIAAVAPILPPHRYAQDEIAEALLPLISDVPARRSLMRRLHAASKVETRSLIMPLEAYIDLGTFRETNDLFISAGVDLAEQAVRNALETSGLKASDVDFLLFTSVTGVSAPSLDAMLATRLGMRPDLKRLPSFGLGCVAGAAGIARLHDYLVGHPDGVALLVSVEFCSLTVQRGDDSTANLVASGLFGDGAAAVVMVGDRRAETLERPGIEIVATRSALYPDTSDVLGWDIGGTGFRIVLGAGVPAVIEQNFAADAIGLLSANGLARDDVGEWMAHPGGPKVLEAFEQALELPADALAASWRTLAAEGNLSSAAVLHVLADVVAGGPAASTVGLLFALGPGVTAELVLLRWPDASPSTAPSADQPVATDAPVAEPGPTPPVPNDSENRAAVPVGSEAPDDALPLRITQARNASEQKQAPE